MVGSTRPGTFRWSRPAPPRWVVLHHTAVSSDSGSLNALTSSSNGRIAQLYEDLTPDSLLGAEPGTIGVNYLVLRSGTVLQLAEERYLTRHAGTGQWGNRGPIYDFNVETIGIEIVGRGNDFTSGQVRNVGRLVADICRRQAIPLRHVAGQAFAEGVLYHRDFAGGLRGKPDPAGWPWSTMMRHAQAYLSGS
ncbi:MAG: N-acetylmuramoyl-L-alanine amidase [Armatimonadetes bacterium]|nr:N-acetylmuramoyl-L-alanine amidase [Armatimonadota bacterium]